MSSLLPALVLPWAFALVLTPLAIRAAFRFGWIDRPVGRKTHARDTALVGGFAVFGAFALGVGATALFQPLVRAALWGPGSVSWLLLATAAVVVLGFVDDLYDLRPGTKTAVLLVVGTATWFGGFRTGEVELPFGWLLGREPLISFVVTIGWIVIVTNAFNLIDGVDGLTAGIGIAASLTLVVLASDNQATVPVIGSLALAGALAGFLRFNLPPARAFLGDGGALGIGFMVSVLSLASFQKSPTAVVLVVPLLALGVPLLDTVLAILRRAARHLSERGLRGLNPFEIVRAITSADRGHIHDLLLRSGWSARRIVTVMYATAAGLSVIALQTRKATPTLRWAIFLGLMALGVVALRALQRRVERREAVAGGAPAAVADSQRAAG